MFWNRKPKFGDAEKSKFINVIADLLNAQMILASGCSIESSEGKINRKVLGYVYGFVDAALRCIAQDMSDESVGVPVTYQVLRHVFPGSEEKCMLFLLANLGKDDLLTVGMMRGGQEYFDAIKPGSKKYPMGLAQYLLATDDSE